MVGWAPELTEDLRMRKRVWSLALVVLTAILLVQGSARADKLKAFYVGNGGITQDVSRVVLVEFATDGRSYSRTG
jgi:hypothetical protein